MTSLCLQPLFCNPTNGQNLWTGEPSVHVHTVALPFYFVTQPVNNTERHVVFCIGRMSPSIYVQVVGVAAFCLTKFRHFYSLFVGLSFDIHTKKYTPSNWAYCLLDGQLFFWCVDILKFGDECVSNLPNFEQWVVVWLSPSCFSIFVIWMKHGQYCEEPAP